MAVPSTNTIKLSDVCLEIYGSTSTVGKTLADCHTAAYPSGFDATYAIAGADTLMDFRNYVHDPVTWYGMSLEDISHDVAWSNVASTAIGANAQDLYDGESNSTYIVAQSGHTASAAKDALDSTLNSHSDWYLMGVTEALMFKENIVALEAALIANGNTSMANHIFWTSNEHNATQAFILSKSTKDDLIRWDKNSATGDVRGIRTFVAGSGDHDVEDIYDNMIILGSQPIGSDTTAPSAVTGITKDDQYSPTNFTFSFTTGQGVAGVECTIDGTIVSYQTIGADDGTGIIYAWESTFGVSAGNTYTLGIKVIDFKGNKSANTTYTWVIPSPLTSVSMTTTGTNSALTACSGTPATTRYHDGSGTYPVDLDRIFTDSAGTTAFNGLGKWFTDAGGGFSYTVSTTGYVGNRTVCI